MTSHADATKKTDPRIERALDRAMELGEIGVKVAVWKGDDLVINTWRGEADRDTGRPVDDRTIFPVFSAGKGLAALAVHMQVHRGLIDYDSPVAAYWPEFGQNGKEGILVRHVLTHRAGLPQMPEGVTPELMVDWDWMIAELEKLSPLWEPNSRSSYLALTFGWLTGEIVRRTDPQNRPFGDFLQQEICEPLGIDSFYVGVPASERDRVAPIYAESFVRVTTEKAPFNAVALPKAVVPGPAVYNRPDVQAGCVPGANAVADAKGVARMFSVLANGGEANGIRFVSEDQVRSFTQLREDAYSEDMVIGRPSLVGVGGYFVGGEYPPHEPVIGSSSSVLGATGAGQTFGWADIDNGFSAAVTHNRMFGNFPPRSPEEHPFWAIGDAVRAVAVDA
jgi:CubicO group peptidase (beta-lactamase class C family)